MRKKQFEPPTPEKLDFLSGAMNKPKHAGGNKVQGFRVLGDPREIVLRQRRRILLGIRLFLFPAAKGQSPPIDLGLSGWWGIFEYAQRR